ncbi:HD domain-containing protein [Dyella halodurans]|uniref:HD domain-containing protein n=1 Tax=Dyella halodurans TaxID=1920171 RepID=A0ABV9C211_9GAMM|nr:HD domain-containing protein [Dyella halodurans]
MTTIAGIQIPDSQLAREVTDLVRDTETDLLFHHSRRVFLFGALTGKKQQRVFDAELLYVAAMFHDMGLMPAHSRPDKRFEVDGANTAADFLRRHGIAENAIDLVWTSIALHTTPGIPEFMKPEVALLTAGVEMDVMGLGFPKVDEGDRALIVEAHPRGTQFKQDIIEAFYQGIRHKPETTFGNVKADVMALKDPHFHRGNFCNIILGSAWPS